MKQSELVRSVRGILEPHFKDVSQAQRQGRITPAEAVPLFPTTMFVGEVNGKFVLELSGAKKTFDRLRLKQVKPPSLGEYFGGHSDPEYFLMGGMVSTAERPFSMGNIALAVEGTAQDVDRRVPGLAEMMTTRLVGKNLPGQVVNVLHFDDPSMNFLHFRNVYFVHQYANAFRVRSVPFAVLVDQNTSRGVFYKWPRDIVNDRTFGVFGVLGGGPESEHILRASQFASLCQSKGFSEPAMTHYLEQNQELLKVALGAVDVRYQVRLPWIAGGPPDKTLLIPDYMAILPNGRVEIGDFKLPLLDNKSVTAGRVNRSYFKNDIVKGISQLSEYHSYFDHSANRRYVEEVYGLKVLNPSLTLVIGNIANSDADRVVEALRGVNQNIEVMNYDTLVNLYMAGSGVWLKSAPQSR